MQVLERQYDRYTNKTHVRIDAGMFTEWYWISGELSAEQALTYLRGIITYRMEEFNCGEVDTPHEITCSTAGLL